MLKVHTKVLQRKIINWKKQIKRMKEHQEYQKEGQVGSPMLRGIHTLHMGTKVLSNLDLGVNLGAPWYANAALQCMRKFRLEKTLSGHIDTCKKASMNCHTFCHALCISKMFTFSILLYYFSSTFHVKVCVMDAKETGITNYMNAL